MNIKTLTLALVMLWSMSTNLLAHIEKELPASKGTITHSYKIRISSLKGSPDKAKFEKIASFGILKFEQADNGFTRVYLGNYLGKVTAKKVLSMVKAAGFRRAYLVEDMDFKTPQHFDKSYTWQFGSNKTLECKWIDQSNPSTKELLYITFVDDFWRLSLGVYNLGDTETEGELKAISAQMGTAGFSHRFR